MNRYIREGDNPSLTAERRKATFDTESLGALIWEGQEKLHRRREINKYVNAHADLHDAQPIAFLSRPEKLENAARKVVAMMEHAEKAIDASKPEEIYYFNQLVGGADGHPYGLHFGMALPTLINNCDEAQLNDLVPKALNREFIATYAQTELGHGTNLKKLETTATYDPKTEEFVLNTPTVTATKWWPGNLGKSSNFTVVMAQLYTHGKCYGPHPFWLQIRDENTHEPLPGVTVGDIGPKFGINSNDNGFLQLHNVRIPRRNMFMKHAKVERDGKYVPPIHNKLGYTSMMYVRSMMIRGMALDLAKASTIAIRYSCVRHQGEMKEGAGELKVLEYQTQQWRLFPQLARSFAYLYAGNFIRDLYLRVMKDINAGETGLLADLHALSCGLKSHITHTVCLGLEQCRMSCGGHGYSEASGFPHLYGVVVGGCTYEGENMVMLLQTARYLMKRAAEIRSGGAKEKPSPLSEYLFRSSTNKCLIDQSYNPDHRHVLEAFQHLARRLTLAAYDRLQQLKQQGYAHEDAWNAVAVDLTKASRAHTRVFLAQQFVKCIVDVGDLPVLTVLKDILQLYLYYELMECSGGLLEDDYLSGQQMEYVRKNVYDALKRIRPNAVSIVDAFDFSDRDLNSVLGRRDGHVYENLLKWAKSNPINKTEVTPFHHKYLGRAIQERKSKL
jgi:acyl-CoA oxidase